MVCWSFSFIGYKQVFINFDPLTVIMLRLAIAVPLLFLVSLIEGIVFSHYSHSLPAAGLTK